MLMVCVRNESVDCSDQSCCNNKFLMFGMMGHVVEISVGVRGFFVNASRWCRACCVIPFRCFSMQTRASRKAIENLTPFPYQTKWADELNCDVGGIF